MTRYSDSWMYCVGTSKGPRLRHLQNTVRLLRLRIRTWGCRGTVWRDLRPATNHLTPETRRPSITISQTSFWPLTLITGGAWSQETLVLNKIKFRSNQPGRSGDFRRAAEHMPAFGWYFGRRAADHVLGVTIAGTAWPSIAHMSSSYQFCTIPYCQTY